MSRGETAGPDALDQLDLDEGRDFPGQPPPAPARSLHPPRSKEKVGDLAERYRLRVGLFRADDAGGPPAPVSGTPRKRKPPTPETRRRDAERKREERRRRRGLLSAPSVSTMP